MHKHVIYLRGSYELNKNELDNIHKMSINNNICSICTPSACIFIQSTSQHKYVKYIHKKQNA